METTRIAAQRGEEIEMVFEGDPVIAYKGETVATALLATQVSAFGLTGAGEPRLPLCNMGTCFDCAVTINGSRLVRACVTDAIDGMVVERNVAS